MGRTLLGACLLQADTFKKCCHRDRPWRFVVLEKRKTAIPVPTPTRLGNHRFFVRQHKRRMAEHEESRQSLRRGFHSVGFARLACVQNLWWCFELMVHMAVCAFLEPEAVSRQPTPTSASRSSRILQGSGLAQ
jgi:hypothetical protein